MNRDPIIQVCDTSKDFYTYFTDKIQASGAEATPPTVFASWYFSVFKKPVNVVNLTVRGDLADKDNEFKQFLKQQGIFPVGYYYPVLRDDVVVAIAYVYSAGSDTMTAEITGAMDVVEELVEKFKKFTIDDKTMVDAVVDIDDDGYFSFNKGTIKQASHFDVVPECYPYLRKDVKTIGQEFLKSNSRIMLLIGPPGTGKTNFIRQIILDSQMKAMVCSDPELLSRRKLYTQFLHGSYNLLVLEDADQVVKAREDGNEIMSLLLNIADGLASSNKRIIISTNLPNLNSVDEALIRPGRCYDSLPFRKLTIDEAIALRQRLQMPEVDFSTQQKWSLSEVLNYEEIKSIEHHRRTSIGFCSE